MKPIKKYIEKQQQRDISEIMYDLTMFMQRPSVMIAMLLFCMMMVVFLQFTGQQAQLIQMQKEV